MGDTSNANLESITNENIMLNKKEVEFLLLNEIKSVDSFLQDEQYAICLEFLEI